MSCTVPDPDVLMVMRIALAIRCAECAAATGIAYDKVNPEPLKAGVVREVSATLRDLKRSAGRRREPLTDWLRRELAGVSKDEAGVSWRLWQEFADRPPPGHVMDMKDAAGRATRDSVLVCLKGSRSRTPKAVTYESFKSKVSHARPR